MADGEAELRQHRWRLVLGRSGEDEEQPLNPQEQAVDALLEKIYPARREGGLPQDRRFSARWFKDITAFFDESIVEIVQQDLIDRLGLSRLLKDPAVLDDLQPNIELATAILSMKEKLPPEAMATARQLV
ncbi:MAG: hypothetical protein KTR24_13685, partial [Saprospiraceae bacterium]|nr:hypothetical protein [Saprospiraceae bacterium]